MTPQEMLNRMELMILDLKADSLREEGFSSPYLKGISEEMERWNKTKEEE